MLALQFTKMSFPRAVKLIFLLLITLSVAGCGGIGASAVQAPTPTSPPPPTPTSPPPPTPTSAPTTIPGFTKYAASGIEMWFPESWQGGDLENDLDIVVGNLKSLGSEYDQIAQMIEANPTAFVLWVFDPNVGDTGYLTSANLVKEQVLSVITLGTYIDALKAQLPSSMVIDNQKIVKVGQYDAARLEIALDISGIQARELMYIYLYDNTVWALTFATSEGEFSTRLPVFEQVASTFSVAE